MSTSTTEIWLLLACTPTEGAIPMRAFTDVMAAHACRDACEAHATAKPQAPEHIAETEENEREWTAWFDADLAWRNGHPVNAYFAGFYEQFAVTSIELVGTMP